MMAGRVKFHAQHREELRTALKTYLKHDQPVLDDVGGGAAVMTWNDTREED